MGEQIKFEFTTENNIIIRKLYGTITINDIVQSWTNFFKNFQQLTSYKGMITDFSQASLDVDIVDFERIAEVLKKKCSYN